MADPDKLLSNLKNWLHETFPFDREGADGKKPPSGLVLDLSRMTGHLTDAYFQVQVHGAENIPREGGAVVVSNHGFLAIESAVFHNVVLRHAGRPLRPVAAHMAWDIPLFNHLVAAWGGIRGDAETVVNVLKQGELVLIYPGGVKEASKGARDREKLFWEGRKGFLKVALRAGVPIVPAAVSGADDVYVRTGGRLSRLAAMLGDKHAAPPLFVGLGLLPLPAPLTFRFGTPMPMVHGEQAAEDEALLDELHGQVKRRVEALLALEGRPPSDAADL